MNAVDTNVYVYAFDADEPAKQAKAIALINRLAGNRADTVLIWQVAGEFLNQLRRWETNGRLKSDEGETILRQVLSQFSLVMPTVATLTISFQLRKLLSSLSHWDSMLLAACKEAGVTTLYSEDMDAGTDYDGLAVVNPFAE